MNRRSNNFSISEKRMLTAYEGSEYVGLGVNSFKKWAEEIKAVRRFGKSVRYDKKVIDEALDNLEIVEE